MLVIILGVGLLFYLQLAGGEQKQQRTEQQAQEDVALLGRVSALPEISCSAEASATNCIDLYKAQAFKELLEDPKTRTRYAPVLGATNITIRWVEFDERGGRDVKTLKLYSNTNAANGKSTITYFVMYDPVLDQKRFAWMTVWRQQ